MRANRLFDDPPRANRGFDQSERFADFADQDRCIGSLPAEEGNIDSVVPGLLRRIELGR